ncbi:cyclic nucleotide-binding domain protein (macronuclear) [Tetrahymena thermophila SB210]|uniref:Cyclic nucleotide-binding domain protein n=1 Tax=Tetrahymena thermophila (strain SB210) TaxID=312017 RepID=I7M1K9_TETTS|nr:cyclic nucleotide-binding domain protein [Tetrahymena thermophila SB210]EAR96538.2 cyclic nucleotide-binding domain protein [Tetrahymena thermophila SB210]|eukprot:XP_001016783.2 cyclic nucleotide-binding domain protein [Tetrahymena thermophila SB210]
MDNWIDLSGLQNVSVISVYIKSLYFSIVTMNTVGYGDFTPKTDLERVIDVMIILIGCVLFGYSISKIGTILQSITKNREQLIQSMGGVNLYMRQNNIELDLQNKIRKYLEYIYIKRDQEIQSNEFINQLSNNLQREILIKVQGEALKKIDIFMNNFSNQFIEELSLKVKQIYFCSDEIIQEENKHIANPSIFILNQGRVEINFRESTCRTLKEKGEYFGQVEFFKMEYQSCYTIKSLGMSSLFQVSLIDFMNLLEKYPIEKETFYKISHSVKFYQSYQQISTACRICCSISHIENDCNYTQYKPNHFKLVKQLHMTQQREKFNQRQLNKYNSILNQKCVENALYSTDEDEDSEDFSQTPLSNTVNGMQNQQINNLEGKNDLQNDSFCSNTFDLQHSLNEENQTDLNNECITLMQKKISQQQKEQAQAPSKGQIIQVFVQQPSKEIEVIKQLNFKQKQSQSDLHEVQSLSRKSIASISSKKRRGSLSLAIDQFQSKSFLDQKQTTSIGIIEQKDQNSFANIKNEKMQSMIKLNVSQIPQVEQIKDFRNISKSQDNIAHSDQNLPISELQQKAFSQIQIQEYNNSQLLDDKINENYDRYNFNQQGQTTKSNTAEIIQQQQQLKPKQIEFKKENQEQNDHKLSANRRRSLPFLQLGSPHKQKQNEIILNNQSFSNIQNEIIQDNQLINYPNNPSFINLNSQLANHFDSLKTQLIEFMQQNTLQTQQVQQQQQLIQLNPRKQQYYSQSFGSKLYFKQATTDQNNYGSQNVSHKLESQLDDIGKDYKIYFPQNNKSNVLKIINIRKQKTGGLNKSKFKHRNTQKVIKQKKSEFLNQK